MRIWSQDKGLVPAGQSECRGKVQRTVDGEARQFQDWGGLVSTLPAMLAGTSLDTADAPDRAQPNLQKNRIREEEECDNVCRS